MREQESTIDLERIDSQHLQFACIGNRLSSILGGGGGDEKYVAPLYPW